MTPDEVVASIEVAVFILMGLVVIPLVWSYLRRGKEANITIKPNMWKPGESVGQGLSGSTRINMSPRDRPFPLSEEPLLNVTEEFYKEQLEKYEEQKKQSQQSQ